MSGADDATRPIGSSRASLPPPPPPGGASRRPARRGFGAVLGWTVANAVVPGTAFLAAGRRRVGAVLLLAFLLLVGGAVWLATRGQRTAVGIAVDTGRLGWLLVGVVVVAVLWVLAVVLGYRLLLPRPTSPGRHATGALVVLALVVGIGYPAYLVGSFAVAQRKLIGNVFADDRRSATVVDTNPFGHKERVTVLLLGGDGGEGREGVRTDTVIVASIDTDTGDTTLFSVPRNLQALPFPPDSPLAAVYPDGFDAGSQSESLLNAVYLNGPAMYPDILGPTDDPGADFLKLGVGEALGLQIDYYVLVNLQGFARLVDALGGITVNVNYYVPINGDPGTGELPDDYIAPGRNQHLDGELALQFSRGRFGLSDYERMDRQRCAISAIIDAADPITLLQDYQELATTTQDIVSTDIPRSTLHGFVDLGFMVQDAEVTSVVFDDTVIVPADPDYDLIRQIVRETVGAGPPSAGPGLPPPGGGVGTPPSGTTPPAGGPGAPTATPSSEEAPVAEVGDACAYDPEQARAAREAGKPPSKAD